VGASLAAGEHHFRPVVFAATLAAAILIQIGTNLANDYFDFRKGADTAERLGPVRVASSGLVRADAVLRAAVGAFGAAALLGVYLIVVGGWPILAIGMASIVAGIAYTGGPLPFGYYGLGDLVCFLFFGVVAVTGTYYLQTAHFTRPAVLASLPVACLVTAILVVNNIRDIDTDQAAGKVTLAVRLGRRGTRVEFIGLLATAYAALFAVGATGTTAWWLFWLPLATLPLAVSLSKVILRRVDGPSLNVALRGTARLHLLFGVLYALTLLQK
jgi:1,4-dihydroxy-2-naphthoate octaprenyltransferase